MSVESAELLREANKRKIIQTIKRLLNEDNLYNLPLAKIARSAGVSVKTINNIFGTKNNLIIMTVISAYSDIHAALQQLTTSAEFCKKSGLEQVMALHNARLNFVRKKPYINRIVTEIERFAINDPTEIQNCKEYLMLADGITEYYIAPLEKGYLDGSIKKTISNEEAHAMLFFAFGAVTHKIQSISNNVLINQRTEPDTVMGIVLDKTREFLST